MAIPKELVNAILNEYNAHPKTTLIDYYKYFAQSAFGPGHIVNDIETARENLQKELEESFVFDTIEIQACDYFLPFYRVNLSLVKYEKIDFDEYFDAFIKSSRDVEIMTQMSFLSRWENIVFAIRKMYNMDIEGDHMLAGFTDDMESLKEMHKKDQYLCHHSDQYKKAYNPHYRLIHSDFMPKALDISAVKHARELT